jgi:uncharacterized protein (DUF302 family)
MKEPAGVISTSSPYPVDVTVAKFKATLASRGLTLFAHIDHGAGAASVGLSMPPAHVLIFGQARAGTPLMVARPLLALDLPLRVLVSEDAESRVWVSYTSPDFLAQRYAIPAELVKNISGVANLVATTLAPEVRG